MLTDRRRLILKALVEEYIHSGQPVGSNSIVQNTRLGCSSATVRNELSALEESGHVYQPHVSSGRIPTDAGYRAFVDGLFDDGEALPTPDAEEMRRRYDELAGEVDDLIHETSTVLSHLTHYMAVVLAPTISLARIRKVDLLLMGLRRVLIVLITGSGQVVNRQAELSSEVAPERIAEVERALNASLDGKHVADVRPLRDALNTSDPGDVVVSGILDEIIACLEEADRDRLHHGGIPELLALPEFSDSSRLKPLLGLLEDGLAMLDTLSETMQSGAVAVRIGSENTRTELGHMSLVASGYGSGLADGVVGVIGPTRMDYPRTIAAVRCVAEGLNDALK